MRRRAAAGLALAWVTLVLVFWLGLVVPNMQPGLRRPMDVDLYGYFAPKFWYGSEAVAEGRLPLWNPYEYAGLPLLAAAQPAALYPPKLLAYALFPTTPLHAFMVLHYLLAGVFAFVALRGLGLGTAGAALGTAVWVFTGPNLDSHYHPNRLSCLTWVPLVFLGFARLLERPGPGPAAWLGVAAAMMLLAGYPEYLLDTAVCLLVFWPFAARTLAPRRGAGRVVGWLAVSALLAFALAALQALPTLEMARESVRATERVAPGAESLWQVSAAVPTLAQKAAAVWQLLGRSFPMAAPAWLLGVVGALAGGAPLRHAFLAVLALTVTLASPLRLVLGDVPVFSWLRPNYCWISLAYLPFAYLAGSGLETLGGLRSPAPAGTAWRRGRLALVGVLVAASLPFLAARSWPAVGAASALLAVARAWPVRRGPALLAVALVVVGALWAWNPPAFTAAYPHRFARGEAPYPPAPPLREHLAQAVSTLCGPEPVRVLAPWRVWDGTVVDERIETLQGYAEPLVPARIQRVLRALGAAPDESLGTDFGRFAATPGLLDILNVGCVIAPPEADVAAARLGLERAGQVGREVFYRRPHLPRAFFVARARAVADAEAAWAAVSAGGFDPRREVVLEGAPGLRVPAAEGTGSARVTRREPEEVGIQVTSTAPGYLVVSQAYFPGWEARVDGARVPLYPADSVVMALPVPGGAHEVMLLYRPLSARLGWILTGLGLAALLGLAARRST